jgi:hypothetical protein
LRARALINTINDSLRITQQEALVILAQVENEINMALVSVPPHINPFDFLGIDNLV